LECIGEEIFCRDILWTSCDLRRGRCNAVWLPLHDGTQATTNSSCIHVWAHGPCVSWARGRYVLKPSDTGDSVMQWMKWKLVRPITFSSSPRHLPWCHCIWSHAAGLTAGRPRGTLQSQMVPPDQMTVVDCFKCLQLTGLLTTRVSIGCGEA
jgi:hypothetical protein